VAYTGTDVMKGPGGFGGRPGGMPGNIDPENMPEDFDPSRMGGRGQRPDGEGMIPPEGFEPGQMPEGKEPPEMPKDGFDLHGNTAPGTPRTDFYMNDMVNFFSGVAPV